MIIVDVSEDIGAFVSVILEGTPNHLHSFVVQSYLLVLVVNSSKEK